MRWTPGKISRNLEDRRGSSGGGGFRMGGAKMGLGGAVVLLVLSLLFGENLFDGAGAGGGAGPEPATRTAAGTVQETPEERELVQFVSFVLDDAQSTWAELMPQLGTPYQEARLVLFRRVVDSGCGVAESAMGPFYCPLDGRVYIDLEFYDELRSRFGAPGDFAQAYVITHEIGHHVQHLTGTAGRVRELQQTRPGEANDLSVRLELQADCYSGIWAHSTGERRLLEQGDLEEGLGAAAAVGDDRLQRGAPGGVNPESFTHGTAAQRTAAFRQGFESGDPRSCDTFFQ